VSKLAAHKELGATFKPFKERMIDVQVLIDESLRVAGTKWTLLPEWDNL
jgi:hypothetical protein